MIEPCPCELSSRRFAHHLSPLTGCPMSRRWPLVASACSSGLCSIASQRIILPYLAQGRRSFGHVHTFRTRIFHTGPADCHGWSVPSSRPLRTSPGGPGQCGHPAVPHPDKQPFGRAAGLASVAGDKIAPSQEGIHPPKGRLEAHALRQHWQGLAGATMGTALAERYAHSEPEAHG